MPTAKRKPLKVEYDNLKDIVVIEGTRFSGDYFRYFALLNPVMPGPWMRVVRSERGVVTIEEKELNDF